MATWLNQNMTKYGGCIAFATGQIREIYHRQLFIDCVARTSDESVAVD